MLRSYFASRTVDCRTFFFFLNNTAPPDISPLPPPAALPISGEGRRFTSRTLPPYMRRSPKVAEVLPVLYLRGLSTGDFQEALPILLGKDAAGLSPTNIARLTAVWEEEYHAFRRRSLADRDYVYVWVDGVHFT